MPMNTSHSGPTPLTPLQRAAAEALFPTEISTVEDVRAIDDPLLTLVVADARGVRSFKEYEALLDERIERLRAVVERLRAADLPSQAPEAPCRGA